MFRLPTVIMSTMLLVGCVGKPTYINPQPEKFSFPELEVTRTASLGDTLVQQGKRTKVNALDVYSNTSVSVATLKPNTYIQKGYVGTDTNKAIYFSENYTPSFAGMFSDATLIVNKQKNLICGYDAGFGSMVEATDCSSLNNLQGKGRLYEKYIYDTSTYQQTLIYTGKVGNKVRFTYRELNNESVNIPYTTEIEYDISEDSFIGFKGATLEVIEATNRNITYRVLTNFRDFY